MRRGFLLGSDDNRTTARNPKAHNVQASTEKNIAANPAPLQTQFRVPSSSQLSPVAIPTEPLQPDDTLMTTEQVIAYIEERVKAGNFQFTITRLPERMAHILDTVVTCFLVPGVKEQLLARGIAPPDMLQSFPHRVGAVPGAGKGMFATKDLGCGELIVRERPLLIVPQAMVNIPGNMTPAEYLALTVQNMSEVDRAFFYELHNCKSSRPRDVMGILGTNGLPVGALPGYNAQHLAVCHTTSRINHSCCPNAIYRFNHATLAAEVRALRPIAKDEQITIIYTDVLDSYQLRKKVLQDKYAFRCKCQACSLPPAERKRSDVRRRVIATLRSIADANDGVQEWVADAALPDDAIVARYTRFVEMLEQEAVYDATEWVGAMRPLVKAYCALGDGENARMWAGRAAQMTVAATGVDGGWTQVAAAPERTKWWGLRMATRD